MLADGKLIFSKKEVGRFPVEDEVEERYEALRDGKVLPPIGKPEGGFVSKVLGKLRG